MFSRAGDRGSPEHLVLRDVRLECARSALNRILCYTKRSQAGRCLSSEKRNAKPVLVTVAKAK